MVAWKIWCDGVCGPTNPGPCAWGAVIENPDGRRTEHKGSIQRHGTNKMAELQATIEALRKTPKGAEVILYSRSQYVLKGLEHWVQSWIDRNWMTSKGLPVLNQSLWQTLYGEYNSRKVTLQGMNSHVAYEGRKQATQLANVVRKVLVQRGVPQSRQKDRKTTKGLLMTEEKTCALRIMVPQETLTRLLRVRALARENGMAVNLDATLTETLNRKLKKAEQQLGVVVATANKAKILTDPQEDDKPFSCVEDNPKTKPLGNIKNYAEQAKRHEAEEKLGDVLRNLTLD
jgi:Ribonuclease HI